MTRLLAGSALSVAVCAAPTPPGGIAATFAAVLTGRPEAGSPAQFAPVPSASRIELSSGVRRPDEIVVPGGAAGGSVTGLAVGSIASHAGRAGATVTTDRLARMAARYHPEIVRDAARMDSTRFVFVLDPAGRVSRSSARPRSWFTAVTAMGMVREAFPEVTGNRAIGSGMLAGRVTYPGAAARRLEAVYGVFTE